MDRSSKSLRRFRIVAVLVVLAMCLSTMVSPLAAAPAAQSSAWGTGTLTDQNIKGLIAQMTVEEEDTFIHGSNTTQTPCADVNISPWVKGCQGEAGRIPGVPTLGIPPLRLSDGPAGVRLGHVETGMPAPVGLTASFDRDTARLFGATVGRGLRATNQDVWLAPMMNTVNVPTAGRNFETLGEDAYLAGELAVPLTEGVQREGIIATIKHYVDNDFENGRNSTSVLIDERTQHEIELAAFEKAAKAGAGAAMCSYNRIDNTYACGNEPVLRGLLKGLFNWGGFIMSDWGATHTPQDLIHGLDMEQSGSGNLGNPVINAINSGTGTAAVAATNDMPAQPAYTAAEWKAALDDAVFRILKQMNNIGLLEGTQYGSRSNGCNRASGTNCTPFVPQRPDLQAIQPDEFAKAQLIAERSATLLKNDGNLLPLTNADLSGKGVLVMGPTAIAAYIGGGGSAHVIPYDPVTGPYDALVAAAGAGAKISYVPGYDLDGQIVPSSALTAPDYANPYQYWTLRPEDAQFSNQPGLLRQQTMTDTVPSGSQPVLYAGANAAPDQVDATVNYVASTLPADTGWRWTGTLTAPAGGAWSLKIFVAGQARAQLFVDGLATSGNPNPRKINMGAYPAFPTNSLASQGQTSKSHDPAAEGLQVSSYNVTLTAGQQLHLDLRVVAGATSPAKIQFRWVPPDNQTKSIDAALAAAGNANKVVIFAYDEGSEGSDRGGNAIANGLALPGYQDALVAAVVAANPNTVVVLNTGDPVFMPWAGSVKSILEMWYPGQMGGPATANVLLGNVNPSGKLPETFPSGSAPVGQRFPQDTQPAPCADNTGGTDYYGNYRTGIPGNCPLYPGVYTMGFLGTSLHNYRTINYSDQVFAGVQGNGIFQGYRWYDKNGYTPLFPFGHGLSYTQFAYADLGVKLAGDGLDVTFTVKNTGSVAGAEVPQVYLGPTFDAPVPMAPKALAGFERVELQPAESRQVTIHVAERELSYWSVEKHDWVKLTSFHPIYVGSSSRDIRLQQTVHTWSSFTQPVSETGLNQAKAGQAVPVKFSLTGDWTLAAVLPGYPRVQPVDCTSGAAIGTAFAAASSDGLQYDAMADQYIFVWKTAKSMAGTCARLDLKLDDGTTHSATFQFIK